MRKFAVAAAVAAGFALTSAAAWAANEPANTGATTEQTGSAKPSAKGEKPAEDPDRIVCTREHVVGSNRPQKVCMTVAERERLRDAAIDRSRNGRGADYNTEIGGPGR